MFSNRPRHATGTVVGHLTLWYALICTLVSIVAYVLLFNQLERNDRHRIDSDMENEIAKLNEIYRCSGVDTLQQEFNDEATSTGESKVFLYLLTPDGKRLAGSDTDGWEGLDTKLRFVPAPSDSNTIFRALYGEHSPHHTRVACKRTADGNILLFGVSLKSTDVFVHRFTDIFIVFSIIMLVLSTLSGWLISRRAMSGVHRVTEAVSQISKNKLDQMVPLGHEGAEINKLADAFNEMLKRIGTLVDELEEFSDNVAHDLRSPITRMRGVAETTLTGPQDIEAYREMGFTIIEESDRLTQMINTALEIAQAESGLLTIKRVPVDMNDILKNAVELFQPVAEEKQINIHTVLTDEPLILLGDKTWMQRIVANLLDNGIKYTPPGGSIILKTQIDRDTIKIDVTDTGEGIAPEYLDRIFDRFYRGEKSRSSPGNGLGLSLARTLVEASGGSITVKSSLGCGSTFTLTFPRRCT